ncbi:A/G-specific adenine glycosylase [bacterium]|nr:A/G-specific adenine glycosylase [bacterium]
MNKRLQHNISTPVLNWFDDNGRKDLPWQHDINPYRVWVSEIMLQQTQVTTVIPYFERFMDALPTVKALANATEDQVLHLWTGLGYYSRARNLHKAAQMVCNDYGNTFPDNVEGLCQLPGIGRSTAGAITAIAFQNKAAILDGNVKRVLARYHAVEGWPGKSVVLKTLWEYAEAHMPNERVADYTQAMMDMGATLCTRSKPQCEQCPLANDCLGKQQGNPTDYPGKKPKKTLPIKTAQMLLIQNTQGHVLLEKRPSTGIWGGLWIFPEIPSDQDATDHCQHSLQLKPTSTDQWDTYRHTFSHYHFDIQPVNIRANDSTSQIMEDQGRLWYNTRQPQQIGLAAPVKKLLARLDQVNVDQTNKAT